MNATALNRMRLFLWSLGLFVAVMWLHTRHNDFAWYYHSDEPGKVEQVLGLRPWNFHHPMLLLTTTKVAARASGVTDPQSTVETGRTVSAFFTAVAIVALSLLAYRWRGWPAGVAAGLALLFHHQLYELAHYMKEDSALLFGLAITFVAAHVYERTPSLGGALAIGAGCGLAISGKYLGLISLGVAIPVLLRDRREGVLTAATVALVTVIASLNWPMIADWKTFTSSFVREAKLVAEGQGQVTQSVPHARYWNVFLANTTPITWILLLIFLWSSFRRRRELTFVEWSVVVFPFAYAIALSFSPKDNDRYFLPATALLTVLAAAATVDVGRLAGKRLSRGAAEIGAGLALIIAQFPSWTDDRAGLLRYDEAFQRDDTAELVAFLRERVPPNEAIAKDDKVRLPTKSKHGKGPKAEQLPNEILSDKYVAEVGNLDELRAKGVTHVVITPSTYGIFERQGFRPKEDEAEKFESCKMFYLILKRDYEPLKVWRRSTVLYLHPGLEVYRIVPAR